MDRIIASKAFIYREGRFLLQQRDDTPGIFHPGCWGLFGGRMDPGESPEQCLIRELGEELNWCATSPHYMYPWFPNAQSVVHMYLVYLDVNVSELQLREGAGMALLRRTDMASIKLAPEVSDNMDRAMSCLQTLPMSVDGTNG